MATKLDLWQTLALIYIFICFEGVSGGSCDNICGSSPKAISLDNSEGESNVATHFPRVRTVTDVSDFECGHDVCPWPRKWGENKMGYETGES